jgi:hypothetical protein
VVFNATFNNILVISCRPVLMVEETGGPGENHRHAASDRQTLLHNVVSGTHRLSEIRTHNVYLFNKTVAGCHKIIIKNYYTVGSSFKI